ncbi:MAG: aminotransferase class V-fold PLP-dependent enzyme [Kofleriaceae bacterium]|nr:aminotransferase class V-fold PLP-dependent enzyme [Kofleriaceae bacterium]
MSQSLIAQIRRSVIGANNEIEGPFGQRLVTYADYTASGRCLSFIEDFLREHVLPYYANTHTESSGTGLQTGRFREDARAIIKKLTGCNEEDAVIFCGSGATSAINHLVTILNLRIPRELDNKYNLSEQIPADERPVVFIGPYEHHSNELPWRESICDVVVIEEDEDGKPNQALLIEELVRYKDRPLLIGSFSAASNVTGIGAGTLQISSILHEHGALSFWDFAAAAPYVDMEMNPECGDAGNYKDAMFISPHKFIGGPGTPGILVVKRALLDNLVPSNPGGGTVAYVGPSEHQYLTDPEQREEGGTPDIIGAIRAGLVFQLKDSVGVENIRALEDNFIERAIERWSKNENIQILGNPNAWRLSIVSFLVRHKERYLHHNFVVTLLNDLFGIQVRGGCSCAGPYGHRLLNIDLAQSEAFQREITRGSEGIKPGWARVNFNYFMSDEEFDYVLDAIDFVATNGWRFLPLYKFCQISGLWRHRSWKARSAMSLDEVRYVAGTMTYPHRHAQAHGDCYGKYTDHANRILADLENNTFAEAIDDSAVAVVLNEDFESLRWFVLPEDLESQSA